MNQTLRSLLPYNTNPKLVDVLESNPLYKPFHELLVKTLTERKDSMDMYGAACDEAEKAKNTLEEHAKHIGRAQKDIEKASKTLSAIRQQVMVVDCEGTLDELEGHLSSAMFELAQPL